MAQPPLLVAQKGAGLAVPEVGVLAAGLHQVGVGAVLDELAVAQHHDAVEACHGGQTVRDDDGRAAAHEVLQRVFG